MGSIGELRQILGAHGASVQVARFRAIGRGLDSHVQVHLDFRFSGGQVDWVAASSLTEALERCPRVLARHGVLATTRNRYSA